ncbi:hypothetical protein A3843_04210 [Pseudovibrio exalbescens]|uniref:Uncharacterized protein n=1 Tax=Pseudovibrio exalbescens TaxID=197461 RepID=A0A1U7JLD6_9HYPH|nr:hypothetical protein A3843_04210 [Pseudovibrio exalbescens]
MGQKGGRIIALSKEGDKRRCWKAVDSGLLFTPPTGKSALSFICLGVTLVSIDLLPIYNRSTFVENASGAAVASA